MAAPESVNTLNFSGIYTLNKTLSDSKLMDKMMELQGIGWVMRKTISLGTLTVNLKHFKDDDGVERINITQTLGKVPAPSENRTVNGVELPNKDDLFGHVLVTTERVDVTTLDSDYSKKDWTEDTVKQEIIVSTIKSDTLKSGKKWVVHQTWGFENLNGERRYARRLRFWENPETKPSEVLECRMVYDYISTLAK